MACRWGWFQEKSAAITIKHLTGVYPSGYTLSSSYSGLVIEATAAVSGVGVLVGAPATIRNFGTVTAEGNFSSGRPGITLMAGGAATNGSAANLTALIEGSVGIDVRGAPADITNFATIHGVGGYGVLLRAGGTVTNGSATDTTALIEGDRFAAIAGYETPITVVNFGTLIGHIAGIDMRLGGGAITNGSNADTAALIEAGVVIDSGLMRNFGTIKGPYEDFGMRAYNVAMLTNGSASDTAALIEGAFGGLDLRGSTAVNYGTILGTNTDAARFPSVAASVEGGSLTNGSAADTGALIEGATGVIALADVPVVITNFGTITGSGGTAVKFVEGALGVLAVEAGCVFQGTVRGGEGTLDLASGVGTISALRGGNVAVSGSMADTTFRDFGTLEIGGRGSFTFTGRGTIGGGGLAALIDNGAFTTVGALTIAGPVGGTETLAVAGGTTTLAAGASVSVADWRLTGGSTRIAGALAYAGGFTERAGASLSTAGGGALRLTGAATLSGALAGAGRVTVSQATASGLTVGGRSRLEDAGAVDQTGAVTVGDANARGADLIIDVGATWTVTAGGIARGTGWKSIIHDAGTLTHSGAATSVVAVRTQDTGSIVAARGVFDFTRAITGTGTMSVEAGATLEADGAVAASLSLAFDGAGATLALKDPSAFAATIGGFTAGDAIDLVGVAADSAVLGAGDTLVITNGSAAVATLQLSGDHAGETFATASDGRGGTRITVNGGAAMSAPPPAALPSPHPLVAAAASLGAGFGASHGALAARFEVGPPPLCAPRAMIA